MNFWADQPQTSRCVLTALISTAPLEKLSARLQSLDECGSSLVELSDPSPKVLLLRCLSELRDLLFPFLADPATDSAEMRGARAVLRHLDRHFMPAESRHTNFNRLRARVLSLAASALLL